jgi:methionine-rich copper-binding protein CopC
MKISSMVAGLALLMGTISAGAHTHLAKAVPADGSVITSAPPNIVLTFSEPARLTALSIQKGAEPAQKIARLPADTATEISIPAPQLTPGSYVVSWRVVSEDNHVMSGKTHFTYSGESPADHAAHH